MRAANGGLLLPQPSGLAGAALNVPVHGVDGDQPMPNEATRRALAWFEAIADAGGSPADLELAWTAWGPIAMGMANPKLWAEGRLAALKDEAVKAYTALWEAAKREADLQRHLIEHRDQAGALRRKIEAAEKEVARLRELLARHASLRPAA